MHQAVRSIIAGGMVLATASFSLADGNDVASWMLLLKTKDGAVAIAPTTYETADECNAVVEAIAKAPGFLVDARCTPARMSDASIAGYTAKREAADAAFEAKVEQLERDRPALEAEQKEIEGVPIEKRTKAQMERLDEIGKRLSIIVE